MRLAYSTPHLVDALGNSFYVVNFETREGSSTVVTVALRLGGDPVLGIYLLRIETLPVDTRAIRMSGSKVQRRSENKVRY